MQEKFIFFKFVSTLFPLPTWLDGQLTPSQAALAWATWPALPEDFSDWPFLSPPTW